MRIETQVIDLTPERAKRYLKTSIGNRKIRDSNVRNLVNLIDRGEWRLTHQGIAVDENGNLRDGHHRLMACVKSGKTLKIMVTTGLAPETVDAMDQGSNRSISDLIGVDKRVGEPIRYAATIYFRERRVTAPQVRDIGDTGLREILQELISYCGTTKKLFSTTGMKTAAAIKIMDGESKDFVFGQYAALLHLDFDAMTRASRSLVRVSTNHTAMSGTQSNALLARGLKVFDSSKQDLERVSITDVEINSAVAYLRYVLDGRLSFLV